MGPRTAASATASQWPPERGNFASTGVAVANDSAAADAVAVGPRRGHQMRCGEQGLGDRRRTRRRSTVERIGRPHKQLFGVVGGIEPPARLIGVGEVFERDVQQPGGRVQPPRIAGDLVQREQAGGQRRVILEDRGAVADLPTEAGAAQPAVHDVKVEHGVRALRCGVEQLGVTERDGGLGERGDGPAVPRRDHLVVAAWLRPGEP